MSTYKLNRGYLESLLAAAPHERGKSTRQGGLLISLPGPGGEVQLFSHEDSPIMEGFARELERAVLASPADWLWVQKRWKYPKPADA